jgi:hypothetical protein
MEITWTLAEHVTKGQYDFKGLATKFGHFWANATFVTLAMHRIPQVCASFVPVKRIPQGCEIGTKVRP